MTENFLELGIQAARKGEKDKAVVYLSKVVSSDPLSEEGWLWLGYVLDATEKRKYCYERVLKLNPANKEARLKLVELDEQANQEVLKKPPHSNGISSGNREIRKKGEPTNRNLFNPVLLGVLGVITGILLCGLPLFWLYSRDLLIPPAFGNNPTLALPSATQPVFTPTQTIVNTKISTPTLITITPNTTATLESGAASASLLISQAKVKMANKQFAEAIPILDAAITFAPHLDEPYYLRAQAYNHLLNNLRNLSEYQDYVALSLKDIDQAISLRSDNGDYYYLRGNILENIAGITDYRVDRDVIYSKALENARVAFDLGTTEDLTERNYAVYLILSEQCNEAVDLIKDLIDRTDPRDTSIGNLYFLQAEAYACQGELNKAIPLIEKSMLYKTDLDFRKEFKARYLYQAGRYKEALMILNELIEKKPSYGGGRYYLRAAIFIDIGERKKAEDDLNVGSGNTWGRGGVYSYVLGQMALANGDTEEAISQFQNAEATLWGNDYVLRQKVINKLEQLGALPLEITPSVMNHATPIPTIQPRPTARPLEPTPTFRAGGSKASPTPGLSYPEGAENAIVIDYKQGLSNKVLQVNDFPIFRFQTDETFKVKTVKNIVLNLESSTQMVKPSLQISLYNSKDGGWGMFDPSWGDNPVEFPNRYVYPGGDIFIAIRNWGTVPVTIDYLNIKLIVETEDGRIIVLGPQ